MPTQHFVEDGRDDRPAGTQLAANTLSQLLDESVQLITTPTQQADFMPAVPLIGREEALGDLAGLWTAVGNGQGQLALMPGAVGIGKGRMLAEAARQAHLDDKHFLRGRNHEHGSLPYQPFIDILDTLVRRMPPQGRKNLSPELSRLLPEIGDLPRSAAGEQGDARLQLFTAVLGQWVGQAPILLALTVRMDEIERGSLLDRLWRDLQREENGRFIELKPLNLAQVAAFLRVALGQERLPGWLVDSLHRATGGNPSDLAIQIRLAASHRKFLDCVSQHRAGHHPIICFEKLLLRPQVAFANFSQHPANDFVNQIVFVFKIVFSQTNRIDEIALFDEAVSCHHRDSLFPKMT